MIHLPALIQDLGIILIVAAIVTLLCKKLKQPVVLGYLIAGFLVGPHIPFIPTVTDTESIKVWAEIGVIFLLFGLGLEFSFKKLAKVGKSASITGIVEIVFMLGAGYLTGKILGWSTMDSLFLGGILSISSTTIIVRAFDELGMKGRNFAGLVFGVLIVEDLIAILLLVILSSLAVTASMSGGDLLSSSVRLGFFMALWFLLGIYILPVFLKKIQIFLSDETMLIVSIGLCLMMVIVATHAGFSPALGAFVMGSLLAETREGHRIEHLLIPVRDLFAAVFFVSVGMMIDPKILSEYFGIIVLMTVITILGKLISTTLGALASGRSLKNSVQAGMSLAQIGEFSFIIATLGVTLKVTSDFLYPVAVAVSAVTTFTTPYMIKYADPFYAWIEKRLPENLKLRLNKYELAMNSDSGSNVFLLIWKEYGMKILLNTVVVVAIVLGISQWLIPFLNPDWLNESVPNLISCFICLMLSAPFLWAIVVSPPKHSVVYHPDVLLQLTRLQFGLSMIRLSLGIALIVFVISQFATISTIGAVSLLAVALLGLYFSRFSEPFYQAVEKRFVSNLTEKERDELAKSPSRPELAPWNASLTEFIVSPHSKLIAQALEKISIKEKYGISIAMIQRRDERILAPGRSDVLLPGDRIYALGTEDQLAQLKADIEQPYHSPAADQPVEAFGLNSMILQSDSPYIHKSIRDCGLRETVHGLIVGIERDGERILNPDSSLILQAKDLIWIVGNLSQISSIKKRKSLV